jgi:hypothetical protein
MKVTTKILPIPGFPGYWAGSDGEIYSTRCRERTDGPLKKLKSGLDGKGRYLHVSLMTGRVRHNKNVHRLICEVFHGKPSAKETASHLNGKCKDNRPENLKWESMRDNFKRKKEHGTYDGGWRNSRAVFNEEQIIFIRAQAKKGITYKKILEDLGVTYNERLIGKIVRNEHYKKQ